MARWRCGPVHEAIVDGQSRSVRTATWNLHLDAAHETRTALGYLDVTAGASAIVNPVSIVKRNERGNVLEEIRAVRATTAGEPTASDTFARTDYVAWTVYEYTDCCRLLAVLVYHDIPVTGEGLPWTNYACTTYGYDAVRRRNKTVTPGGTITRVVYDACGNVVQTWIGTNDSGATDADPAGGGASGNTMVLVSEREYDGGLPGYDGLLTEQVLDPSDTEFRQTFYAYDWRHRLVDTTGEEGFFEKRSYDNLGRVTKTERYDGSAAGQLLARSHTFYDDRGRVYRTVQHEVDPATGVIGASLADDVWYDQAGNITKRQPEGVMTQIEFSYDGLGRVTTETDPRSAVTAFAYDAAGNRTSLTDAEDNATTWDYDPVGKVVAETNELNDTRTFEYDTAGNLAKRTDRNGRVIEFAYDDAGRTVEETWLDGTNVVNTITTVYDAEGRVTNVDDASTTCAYGYDGLGRLITVDNDGTSGVPRVVLTAGYNRLDERTSLSASVAGTADFANAWLYDGLGRASRLMQTGQAGGNAVAAKRVDFGYTKFGGFGTISRHDNTAGTALVATTNHTYDGYGRLTGTSHAQGTTSLSDYTRTFDSNRRVGTAATPDGVTAYGYDAAGQLTSADHSFQADEAYSYDGTGNRTNAGYVTGTNNRLLNDGVHSYEYDPEGNRTKRTKTATGEEVLYEWDHRNRLTGVTFKDAVGVVTQDVEYVYDPQDRRIVKRLDADGNGVFESEERFVFDQGIKGGLDDAVLVFDETGVLTYRLLHGPAVDQPLTKEGTNGDVLWMFADPIGTVRDLAEYAPGTGSTSVVNHLTYDSFGKITSQTNSAHIPRYGFTGREWDVDADLWWYRARWYDPSPAHFLCEDEGGRVSTANRSTYAENNPVLMIDPDGNMTLLEYLTLQRLRWWADPRTPETRVAACVVGAILARDRLTTPQEKAAWDRYTSGTGQDIILSPAEMAAWIADDAGVWSELGKLFGSCASGKSGEGSSGKSSVNVNRPPHSGSIGNTNLSISWSCSKCCLSYTITLSDRYDFDPKSLFSSPRTIKNELKTRAEYAWENFWECGWRPFHHKGIMTGTLCNS